MRRAARQCTLVGPGQARVFVLSLAAAVLTLACTKRAEPGAARDHKAEPTQVEAPAEPPPYPLVDPATITPLEVLRFPTPVGPGYKRVPIRMGPALHSGKWLGLANGDGEFMGPRHIIVNHFSRQPDYLGEGELIGNVLLDVETGEVVAEFAYGRHVQWHFGLAIVFKEDDERPYLLDAASGEFVLAIPEGEHEYVYGKNYWLRFSPIAKRVWVTAKDSEGTVHLYAWEQLQAPPELPNNPFPFMPDTWDPMQESYFSSADSEEVQIGFLLQHDDCTRVILKPPKGYECLDELGLEDSRPLADGWRVDPMKGEVFNRRDGRGLRFGSLCDEADTVFPSVMDRSPPKVEVTCEGDPSVWLLWTPPDRVQRMDPEDASKTWTADLFLHAHDDIGRYELKLPSPPGISTLFDSQAVVRELLGDDYLCDDTRIRTGNEHVFGSGCKRGRRPVGLFELVDRRQKIRSARFQATDMAVSETGAAVAVIRRNGRDQIVPLSIGRR